MNIAVNGFGRIGRTFFRAAYEKGLNVAAINDLGDPKTLAHLLKWDSTYGKFQGEIALKDNAIVVDDKEILFTQEKDPTMLPWKKMEVGIVIESTGIFTNFEDASKHLQAGAQYVVITAPAKGDQKVKTIVPGVNEDAFSPETDKVLSMASCTTNCLVPVAAVLDSVFGIEKALMSTIHSFTMDQVLQDAPHKDLRRARSALQSIIPTTTGATKATAEVLPSLKDKMNGLSFRVPTATVSVMDFVALLKQNVSVEALNNAFVQAAGEPKYQGAIAVVNEPLVSIDFKGNPNASIVDLLLTQVVGGNLVKIIAWYDNELGYSHRLVEFCKYIENKLKVTYEQNECAAKAEK